MPFCALMLLLERTSGRYIPSVTPFFFWGTQRSMELHIKEGRLNNWGASCELGKSCDSRRHELIDNLMQM